MCSSGTFTGAKVRLRAQSARPAAYKRRERSPLARERRRQAAKEDRSSVAYQIRGTVLVPRLSVKKSHFHTIYISRVFRIRIPEKKRLLKGFRPKRFALYSSRSRPRRDCTQPLLVLPHSTLRLETLIEASRLAEIAECPSERPTTRDAIHRATFAPLALPLLVEVLLVEWLRKRLNTGSTEIDLSLPRKMSRVRVPSPAPL